MRRFNCRPIRTGTGTRVSGAGAHAGTFEGFVTRERYLAQVRRELQRPAAALAGAERAFYGSESERAQNCLDKLQFLLQSYKLKQKILKYQREALSLEALREIHAPSLRLLARARRDEGQRASFATLNLAQSLLTDFDLPAATDVERLFQIKLERRAHAYPPEPARRGSREQLPRAPEAAPPFEFLHSCSNDSTRTGSFSQTDAEPSVAGRSFFPDCVAETAEQRRALGVTPGAARGRASAAGCGAAPAIAA